MKKFLNLLALSAFLVLAIPTAKAQSSYMTSNTNGTSLDTVTDAGTRIQTIAIAGYNIASIEVDVIKLTGTNAGTITLLASNTGIAGTYVQVPTFTDTGTNALENVTSTGTTFTKIFRIPISYYTHYQVKFVGSGTQSTTLKAFAVWRRPF